MGKENKENKENNENNNLKIDINNYDFDTDVLNWNKERNFIKDKPSFDLEKDMGYIMSEVLESIFWEDLLNYFIKGINASLEQRERLSESEIKNYENVLNEYKKIKNHDDAARFIMKIFLKPKFSKVDYVDLITDIEIFGVGGRGKIGMTKDEINLARAAVMNKNHSKKPGDVDEHGKQRKGSNWTPPEEVIEKILNSVDERYK